ELGVGILAIEVDGGHPVPRAVAGDVDAIVFGGASAAAGAADADVGVMPDLGRVGAVEGDEGEVLLGVAACIEAIEVGAELAFGAGEDEAEDGLVAGVGFVIDLVVGIGKWAAAAVKFEGWGRPGP